MNLLKSVVSRVTGTVPSPELATLEGKLYLLRPTGVRSSKECIYLDCMAAIRKTTREHSSELVISRLYNEGEQELIDEDDELEDEKPFLIDEMLNFSAESTSDEVRADDPDAGLSTFTWFDPSGDEAIYLFVCSKNASSKDIRSFEDLMYRSMWERKYQHPGDKATTEDLDEFRGIEVESAQQDQNPEVDEDDEVAQELTSKMGSVAIDPSPQDAPKSPTKRTVLDQEDAPQVVQETIYMPPENRKILLTETVALCLFDKATQLFMEQEKDTQANLWLVEGLEFPCWLTVAGQGGRLWVSTPIDNSMPLTFEESALSLVFNLYYQETKRSYTWLLRCPDKATFNRLNTGFARGLFEATSGKGTWAKLSEADQEYSKETYVAGMDVDDPEGEFEEEEEDEQPETYETAASGSQEEVESEEEDEEESEEDENAPAPASRSKNSSLAVGYKNELSFVVRGDMIGVFKSGGRSGKKLKFMTSISGITTPDKKRGFAPSKVMLHEQDSSMILRDPMNPSSLYRLDLETGRVVEELSVGKDVVNFLPGSKFAQTTGEKTFIGHSSNALFRIDPRLAGSKLVDSDLKQYVGKNQFSAATTTEQGGIAVASEKGDIRLFDTLGKNAKTALPAFGKPITSIDATKDGRWIVATTDTFLLLIDTLIGSGRYKGNLGFDRSFPAADKPKPIRLQLKPEHVAYMGGRVRFTAAKFNTGPDTEERSIITSSGPFVISFNFRRVKQGYTENIYTIKHYDDVVVADSFKFNAADRDILVTLTNDIFMESKKNLQKPTRDSFGSIVKGWDA